MSARLTPEVRALRAITEAQWQTTVNGILTAHGWTHYHAPDNKPIVARSGRRYVQNVRAGWPDVFAVRGTRAVAAELKRETGTVAPEQDDWLERLGAVGIEVYVWRPSDRAEVLEILR